MENTDQIYTFPRDYPNKQFILMEALDNFRREDGVFSIYENRYEKEEEHGHYDRKLQIIILKDLATQAYDELNLNENIDINNEKLLRYIGMLIVVNAMARGDEKSFRGDEKVYRGWVQKVSRMKAITAKMLDQFNSCLGDEKYNELCQLARQTISDQINIILNDDYKLVLSKKIKIDSNNLEASWSKFNLTVRALSYQLQKEDSPSPEKSYAGEVPLQYVSKKEKIKFASTKINEIKELYSKLQAIVVDRMSYKERFKKMNELRPVIEIACQKCINMRDKSTSMTRSANLVFILNLEMLRIYRRIAHEACQAFFFNKKVLKMTIQQAIHCCEKILFYSYREHLKVPSGLWLELHNLYKISLQENIEKSKLSRVFEWHNQFSTLRDMYHHCLLLGISNAYGLNKEEISNLVYAMEGWGPLVKIKKTNNGSKVVFILDPLKDSWPYSINIHQQSVHGQYIILDEVIDRLEELMSLYHTQPNPELAKKFSYSELTLSPHLIEFLISTWKKGYNRSEERKNMNCLAQVSLGVEEGYDFVRNKYFSFASFDEMDKVNIKNAENEINLNVNEISAKPINYKKYNCEIINESKHGCCIGGKEFTNELECGQIIVIEKSPHEHRGSCTIGIIRWFKKFTDNIFIMGIKLLGQNAFPAKASLVENKKLMPTLLLPIHHKQGKEVNIIAPALSFKNGEEIDISFNNQIYRATLVKTLSSSPYYNQFEIIFSKEKIVLS